MKLKTIILFIILIITLSIIISSEEFEDSIGDTSESITNKLLDDINYKEIRIKTVIGFKTVYKQEEYLVEECNYSIINETHNTTLDCWEETHYRQVVDDKAKGDPIYSYSDITALEYDGERIDFIGKGCFICEEVEVESEEDKVKYKDKFKGRLLLCLPDTEYRPNIKNCWVESGGSYEVRDLDTGELLGSHLDNGVSIG